MGYLPEDVPEFKKLVVFGFQHVLTMFPATVLAALLVNQMAPNAMGFDIATVLFASGLATVVAVLLSKRRIPMYYGSSFSYIAPLATVVAAGGVTLAQVGIVGTALVNILAGFAIIKMGKERLDKLLPPIVTGSVAMVIGFALAGAAINMASQEWSVALVTLFATVGFAVYLRNRGFLGMIPVLLGAIVGYLYAWALGVVDFSPVYQAAWFQIPRITFPDFAHPMALWAVFAIAPIAVATIPESTAHLYQISLYIDKLAEEMKRKKPGIANLVGLNLVLDGLGDLVNGLLGGFAGTNYGENNSLMVITRNYSSAVIVMAGVIAMGLAFVGKLAALISTIPTPVMGGLAIYLFGAIGFQGIALMKEGGVDLYHPRDLAIGAVIAIVGIGGAISGGNIEMYGVQLPAIATAALLGIVMNLVLKKT